MESRKKAVSIRLNAGDLRVLRSLSRRLGVRYSDLIRFAIRATLARLDPLTDPGSSGRGLVPVFVEAGADMVRYLDLDASDIEAIINEGASEEQRVDREDVQLLAMSGAPHPYARLRLATAGSARSSALQAADLDAIAEAQLLPQSLRKYLYDKYVYDNARHENSALQPGAQPQ